MKQFVIMGISFEPRRIVRDFSLHHEQPELFFTAQWTRNPRSSFLFLIYRWIFAAFFIGIMLYGWMIYHQKEHLRCWPIYLTNWTVIISATNASVAVILTTCYHFEKIAVLKPQSIVYKVYWLLSTISLTLSVLVSVVQWTLVYEGL